MPVFSLTCEVAAPEAEDGAARLVLAGAGGVEVREEGVVPMPGDRRPGPGLSLLVAWFATREEAERAAAQADLAGAIAEEPERDWGEAWKEGIRPLAAGRVFVRPSWSRAEPPPGFAEVVLDPGMAFGTGSHPTTAMCLRALSGVLLERPGASVLDVGTGSGLLAIAAAALGAGRVAATEGDPVALVAARENARRNGVGLELSPDPSAGVPGTFDLVVANIMASTLVELAPAVAARLAPGGTLLLSGLLVGQEDEVRGAYLALGLSADPARGAGDGEWRLLALARRG